MVTEHGHLVSTNEGWEAVVVKEGSYEFDTPDGQHVMVTYRADETGFHANGTHVPK